jgi:hypothetical protein
MDNISNQYSNPNINQNINPSIRPNPRGGVRPNTFIPKLPRSVPPVYNKNVDEITSLYRDFVSGDFEQLNAKIDSGVILNVKLEGKTLIIATIENSFPSMTEGNKLLIIEKLVGKSVSVNSMDKFNKTALHYAAERGYLDIINYLVKLDCDINSRDNEGNTPVHLLINNFIIDCKNDELLDNVNRDQKNIKVDSDFSRNTSEYFISRINEILKDETDTNNTELNNILKKIEKIIHLNQIFKMDEINNIFVSNSESLNAEIVSDIGVNLNINEKIFSNVEKTQESVRSFYDNFKLSSDLITLDDLNKKTQESSNVILRDINKKISESHTIIDQITKIVESDIPDETVNNFLFVFNTTYYLFYLISSALRLTDDDYIFPQEEIIYKYLNGEEMSTFFPQIRNANINLNFPNNPKPPINYNDIKKLIDTTFNRWKNNFKRNPNLNSHNIQLDDEIKDNYWKVINFLFQNIGSYQYYNNIITTVYNIAIANAGDDNEKNENIKNLFEENELDSLIKNKKLPYPNSFNPALGYPNPNIKYFCKKFYKVNDVGFPIVNNFDKSLTDNNLKSINLTNNELYKGIPKISDKSNNNKFYIKHNDFSKMFNKNLGNINIMSKDYEIKSNSTDMSINKCLLNIILDQLNLLFTNKKYNFIDMFGNLNDITNNVNQDDIYVKTNINIKFDKSNDKKLPNIQDIDLIDDNLRKGIPLITLQEKIDLNYENESFYRKYLYLLSTFDKSGTSSVKDINTENLRKLRKIILDKENVVNIKWITPNLVKSDLVEITKLNDELIKRGNQQTIFDSTEINKQMIANNMDPIDFDDKDGYQQLITNQLPVIDFKSIESFEKLFGGYNNNERPNELISQMILIHPYFDYIFIPNDNLKLENDSTPLIIEDLNMFFIKRKEYLEELKEKINLPNPTDEDKFNYILELTVVNILEKNLTSGILNSKKNKITGNLYNFENKNYIHGHIYSLFSLIKDNLSIIKKNYLLKINDLNQIMEMSLKSFLAYFNQIYQLVINNLNNILLADNYIQQIYKDKNIFNVVNNNISSMIDWIYQNPDIDQASKDLLNIHFNGFWAQVKEHLDLINNFKDNKYNGQLENFYRLNISLLTKIQELSKEYEKFNSVKFLQENINLSNGNPKQNITDTFYNKFVLPNNFPTSLDEFKIYGPDFNKLDEYSLAKALDLFPIYYDYNYNQIYTNLNNMDIRIIDSSKPIVASNFGNTNVNLTNNDVLLTIDEKYKEPVYNFNIENKKLLIKDDQNIFDNLCDGNAYLEGYDLFTNLNIINLNNGLNNNEKEIFNKIIGDINTNNKFKPDFGKELKIFPGYKPNLVRFLCDSKELVVDGNDPTVISLNNTKELLELLSNEFTNHFITTYGDDIINNFFTSMQAQIKDKKKKEEYVKLLTYIKSNEKVKRDLIKAQIQSYLNMTMGMEILIQTRELVDKYIKILPKNIVKKSLKKIIKNRVVSNLKSKFADIFSANMDTKSIELIDINVNKYNLVIPSKNKRVIGNKCVNTKVLDKFYKIFKNLNLREVDKNGNTILNKMIDQYNIEGIKKILELDPGIKTFLNSREQNSIQYIIYKIKNEIQDEYYKNLESRIKQYSQVLQNEINFGPEKSGNVNLDDSSSLVCNLILNSIYMFNEFIWVKMLNFPGQWTLEDKIALGQLLNINSKDENLLIKTFNLELENKLREHIQQTSNVALIKDERLETLNFMLKNIQNKIAQLEKIKANPSTIKLIDITTINNFIDQNKNQEKELINSIDSLSGITGDSNIKININLSDIENANLINQGSIDYDAYNELVTTFNKDYYQMILILNDSLKVKDDPNSLVPSISDAQLKIISMDYSKLIEQEDNIKLVTSFYKNIINNLYAEFEDFDKYDDIEYNTVFQSILNIVKINVINVVGIELYNSLLLFTFENTTNNNKIDDTVEAIILEDINELLKASIYEKLKVKNPDSITNNTDILINKLISDYNSNLNPGAILDLSNGLSANEELGKMIQFYKTISENIALNIYGELNNLLSNMKKISLLLQIIDLLKEKI